MWACHAADGVLKPESNKGGSGAFNLGAASESPLSLGTVFSLTAKILYSKHMAAGKRGREAASGPAIEA